MSTVIYPSPVFGPVQSRRLGLSLGVNLLPDDGKICNFDCVYCECGLNRDHRPHHKMPSHWLVCQTLEQTLQQMQASGVRLDAITFAGNGEPTMHPDFERIARDVARLRRTYQPAARQCLLTNATRIHIPRVVRALADFDRICLKLDTASESYIRRINRPSCRYSVEAVVAAMAQFSGRCTVQTMFMQGTWEGLSVDNTVPAYVEPWLQALAKIRPCSVDLYTIARETPGKGLKKVPLAQLEAIAGQVRALGIEAHSFG